MSAIGPHLYLDLLPDPELWMRRHPALLGSVLAEGMVSHTDVRLPLDAARRALDGLLQGLRYGRSMQARFAAPGDRTLAAWGPGASAAAFQGVDGFHHLSAHWTWRELETDGPGRTARLAEERRRYLEENRDWFASMREASEDRHRRYTEWLVGLRARAPVSRVRARCLRGMAGPPPGYRVGVEEADPTAAFPATPGPDDLLRAVSRTASRTCDDFTADLASVRTCLDGLRMDPSRLRGLA
jgi:hypothetical protein